MTGLGRDVVTVYSLVRRFDEVPMLWGWEMGNVGGSEEMRSSIVLGRRDATSPARA